MKQITKKLFASVLFLCMLTVSSGSILQVFAASKTTAAAKTTYAAFGDSIAAGYGLNGYSDSQGRDGAPSDSYQALLADFLKTTSCNYAVTGDDSDACIKLLRSGAADADLKKASVITLSIGSNDLLLPFIRIVMDYFEIDPKTVDASMFTDGFQIPQADSSKILEYLKQAEGLLAALEDNAELHAQAAAFPKQLGTILSLLRKKAPASEIYVTNIYNPFRSVPLIGTMAETYIQEINAAFDTKSPDYTLIDVYTPFSQEALTNVQFDLQNPAAIHLDPHPSVQGHKVIAEHLIHALKTAHTPKAASIQSLTSNKKYKLTAKIKLPSNADGFQIRCAASKNGSYQTLASASKTTYRTNSSKLKKGKTYYVKIRTYKKVNGVTYYGRSSSAVKVKIKR